MTKSALSITLSIVAVIACGIAAQAAPIEAPDQASGLLTSPPVQTTAQDPAVQKAVEWIVRTKSDRSAQNVAKPTHLRAHRDLDHVMILGYPDTVPM